MKRLVILGCTGSIGTTCINSIRDKKLDIDIVGLVCSNSEEKIKKLADEFNSPYLLTYGDIYSSPLSSFLKETNPDIVLNAISGFDGLFATKTVLENSIDLALANKESVVAGASFIFHLAKEHNAKIIPVDSEHSAIYHLLQNREASSLIITASGGPFVDREDLENVTLEEALKHPTWKMGKKITIDSATLANKGLEVIEASYLFGFKGDDIEVTVHRQSIVHSLIRTKVGEVYAELSPPDMALAIMRAVSDKKIDLEDIVKPLSFKNLTLTFEEPKTDKFPLLKYAYDALALGFCGPIVYNASNECAVEAFIEKKISFIEISKIVKATLERKELISEKVDSYTSVYNLDRKTREIAKSIIEAYCGRS